MTDSANFHSVAWPKHVSLGFRVYGSGAWGSSLGITGTSGSGTESVTYGLVLARNCPSGFSANASNSKLVRGPRFTGICLVGI